MGVQALGGIVRAQGRDTGDQLIGTPADHMTLTAIGRLPTMGAIQKTEIKVKADLVAKQSLVNERQDFVPTPEGYTLWSASIETEIGQKQPVRIGIEGHNLLDTTYREYTSLLRYFGDQPGRDVRVRVGFDF